MRSSVAAVVAAVLVSVASASLACSVGHATPGGTGSEKPNAAAKAQQMQRKPLTKKAPRPAAQLSGGAKSQHPAEGRF